MERNYKENKMGVCPYTLIECYSILDRNVDPDNKLMVLDESISEYEFHLDLGLWIRNNLIYNNEVLQKNIKEQFAKAGNSVPNIDEMSTYLIFKYRIYLEEVIVAPDN